jgi:hypothetical protein
MDHLILCKIRNNQETYKINFSSKTTIKEIKQNIFNNYLKNISPENKLIKLYFNSKELKPDNLMLSNVNHHVSDELDITMVALTLTDDMKNDDMKINEAIIKNFSKNCEIHTEEKCVLMCLACSHCICEKCRENDHKHHDIMKKFEILNMEEKLKDIYENLNENFKNLGIHGNYNEFYKNFKIELKKQSDDISIIVDKIKNKEVKLLNSFKLSFDQIFPSLLDYKEKIEQLHSQYDNKKEIILKNDKEFIEFFQKVNSINSLSDKTNENLDMLKQKLEKYQEIFNEFKHKTENILIYINEQFKKLKDLQTSQDNLFSEPNQQNINDNLSGIFNTPMKHFINKYSSSMTSPYEQKFTATKNKQKMYNCTDNNVMKKKSNQDSARNFSSTQKLSKNF